MVGNMEKELDKILDDYKGDVADYIFDIKKGNLCADEIKIRDRENKDKALASIKELFEKEIYQIHLSNKVNNYCHTSCDYISYRSEANCGACFLNLQKLEAELKKGDK